MNADTQSLEETVAFKIAAKLYGGVDHKSYEWFRCLDIARDVVSDTAMPNLDNLGSNVTNAFKLCEEFNKTHPISMEGSVPDEKGNRIHCRVEQKAMVFPDPGFFRARGRAMAWFSGVGWRNITEFVPEAFPIAVADEITQIGISTKGRGRLDAAKYIFEAALLADPNCWHALNEQGVALMFENKFHEAVVKFTLAIAANAASGQLYNNRAMCYRAIGRAAEALEDARVAMRLLPGQEVVELNAASALDDMDQVDDCLEILNRFCERHPDNHNLHYNKALVLMSNGRFEEGWDEYDWRLNQPAANAHYEHYDIERWRGQDLNGKNVLIWGEQGLGDEIFTSTMIPDVLNMGATVTLLCEPRLVPIFRRSFPQITVDQRPSCHASILFQRVRLAGEHLPTALLQQKFDYQMSQQDLGKYLRPTFESFPMRAAPLKCDVEASHRYRQDFLQSYPGKKIIGISWHSKRNPNVGAQKGFPLADMLPILQVPNCVFVNLQYGDNADEIAALKNDYGIDVITPHGVDALQDLEAFAAVVAAMDRVITVSNTTAHIAGGLNVPTWVLTPASAGKLWYWFKHKVNSPWYPSVTLRRQTAASQWATTIQNVAYDLAN